MLFTYNLDVCCLPPPPHSLSLLGGVVGVVRGPLSLVSVCLSVCPPTLSLSLEWGGGGGRRASYTHSADTETELRSYEYVERT